MTSKKRRRDKLAELEKTQILDPEELVRRRNRTIKKSIYIALGVLGGLILAIFTGFQIVRAVGKANLRGEVVAAPKLEQIPIAEVPTVEEEEVWQEGWVKYQDQIYAYNEDILTFLIMGIDKRNEVKEVKEGTKGGQADAQFLLVLNPHENTLSVISINRNTMTDISIYDENGAFVQTAKAQIAVQHGFGNGVEKSCEYQVEAVKHLFYDLPINGYCAINMDAVVTLTDLLGGMELTALSDVKSKWGDGATVVKKGETINLDGRQAYSYVCYRDTSAFGSANDRLERQKQFINQYINSVKTLTKKDITYPVEVYKAVEDHMTTDITVDELTYLVSIAKDYHFDQNRMYSMQGETKQGEKFEEFYPDESALYQLILDIFYEPVEKNEK